MPVRLLFLEVFFFPNLLIFSQTTPREGAVFTFPIPVWVTVTSQVKLIMPKF